MKRKGVFLAVSLMLLGTLSLHAEDWTLFGFKGKVLESKIDYSVQYKFTNNGRVTYCALENERNGVVSFGNNPSVTSTTIKGDNKTGTISNGKIVKVTFKESYSDKTVTLTYTYDSKGLLTKVSRNTSWTTTKTEHINASASMNAAVAKYKSLKGQLAKMSKSDPRYASLKKQVDAAARAAAVNSSAGQNIKHTQAHSDAGDTKTFSDYEFDSFGNWTKRMVCINGGNKYEEVQVITYDPEFLLAETWKQLEKEGDLNKIEEFYNDKNTTDAYKQKAATYWNAHVFDNPAVSTDITRLADIVSAKICSKDNFNKAIEMVQPLVYARYAEHERDYAKLRKVAENKIFNDTYRKRVLDKADKMYADSVVYLEKQGARYIQAKQYDRASANATAALKIAPDNKVLKEQLVEADYWLLMDKRNAGSATSADYAAYYTLYPESPYDKEVHKMYNHQYTLENRGRIWHLGFGFEGTVNGAMADLSGGLGLLLGYRYFIVNGYIGAQFGYILPLANSSENAFSGMHITIPVMARVNFKRDFKKAWYAALGVNLNMAVAGQVKYEQYRLGYDSWITQTYKSTDLFGSKFYVSPRVGIGFATKGFEWEVFGLYDVTPIVGTRGTDNVIIKYPGSYYKNDGKFLNKQIKQRISGGMALRFIF